MANVTLATQTANATLDGPGRAELWNSGQIEIRDGTQPTTADDPVTGTVLATFTLDASPLQAASGGTASLADLPLQDTAAASGTATWYRVYDSGGSAVEDGDVSGTGGGGAMELSSTTVTAGVQVKITGGGISQPLS